MTLDQHGQINERAEGKFTPNMNKKDKFSRTRHSFALFGKLNIASSE